MMKARMKTRHGPLSAASLTIAALLAAGLMTGTSSAATQAASADMAAGSAGPSALPIYLNTHYPAAERAADLVSRMTLAEKVGQLATSAPAIPRLGVKAYNYWNDGEHGVDQLGQENGAIAGARATSFPTSFAATMSWDKSLVDAQASAIADEARAFTNTSPGEYDSLTYWTPTVNMDRDPRWGRTDEGFGEDPYLVGQMAGAYIDGYQDQTLSGKPMTPYLKVAATAKHFLLNNVDNNRTSDSSNTTDANIRDYYTRQFQSLIENAHVAGIMTSYNAVNGTPSPTDTYATNEVAQRTYGFNGYITSDCDAVGTVWEDPPAGHGWAAPGWTSATVNGQVIWTNQTTGATIPAAAGAEAYALRAGTQLDCTGAQATLPNIQAAINAGILSVGVIDTDLTHVFTIRMQTGEFDPPGQVPYTKITKSVIQSPAHQALAEKVAANDLVLLKNGNVAGTGSPLLPVDPSKLSNVVVVGNLANTVTLGGYSGGPSLQVNAVQGITAAVKAANPNATVTFDGCGTSTTATAPASCPAATQAAIKSADLVIVVAGTDENVAGEGRDRTTLAMPGNYNSLISEVNSLGNPRTALVTQSGGPVDISGTQGDFPAIVFSGYNGESQGTALARVLFGQQNPAGHLDFTWYKDDSQLPAMENYGLTPSQTGGLGRTYQYFTGTPTYPFGYGLSYSTFKYSNIAAAPQQVSADGTVHVNFNVTNTGSTPGATVAQLYVAPPGVGQGDVPLKQLAGFQRTSVLQPGQTQHVSLAVKAASLSHWDEQALKQVVADGTYQFRVGPDAATVAGSASVDVTGAITPRVQYVTVQPDQVILNPGDTLNLAGKNPWIANDTNQSLEQPHATADDIVEAVNNDQSFVDLSHANVTYASSNPNVATVSPTGQVTAVGHGVTTISVTVNGVTGSAPLVVQQPFTLNAPTATTPGSTINVTAALPDTSSQPLKNVSETLSVPSGWTATATSPTTFAQVAPGQTAQTTWHVTVPAGASPGSNELDASVSFTDANGPGTATATAQVALPYGSLSQAFNNTGISDDSNPTAGSLDSGYSYSAQALAGVGLTPGVSVKHDGLTFTWPDVQPGQPDDVVAAGQVITLSGSGTTLGILGAGTYGSQSGTGTITYTDGSTQLFNLSFPDWFSNTAPSDGDILASMPYINYTTGRLNQEVSVYYAGVPLEQGKTVAYVTLPDVSTMHLHLFAVAIG